MTKLFSEFSRDNLNRLQGRRSPGHRRRRATATWEARKRELATPTPQVASEETCGDKISTTSPFCKGRTQFLLSPWGAAQIFGALHPQPRHNELFGAHGGGTVGRPRREAGVLATSLATPSRDEMWKACGAWTWGHSAAPGHRRRERPPRGSEKRASCSGRHCGKWSGVVWDVLVDHVLAQDFERLATGCGALTAFAGSHEAILTAQRETMPERSRRFFDAMVSHGWLVGYRDPETVEAVLVAMSRRRQTAGPVARGVGGLFEGRGDVAWVGVRFGPTHGTVGKGGEPCIFDSTASLRMRRAPAPKPGKRKTRLIATLKTRPMADASINFDALSYNSMRDDLVIPEYGRSIHQMVEHCLTIADKAERSNACRSHRQCDGQRGACRKGRRKEPNTSFGTSCT